MGEVLSNISNIIIPIFFFYITTYALIRKSNLYDNFVVGAKRGLETVIGIMPTLIGLMVAVGVLRASGFFDFIQNLMSGWTEQMHLPSQIVPLILVRMFSSSAATGIVLDLFKTYGTDSYVGLLSSIMMSSTETIFYTMSVYFMAAKITHTRWTLTGALLSTLAGIVASVVLAGIMT